MQPMLFNPEKDFVQPVNHNFISFLKASELSDNEIGCFLDGLKSLLSRVEENSAEYFAIKFALESTEGVRTPSKRECRKQQCYYIYKSLDKTKMKRSEKIKVVAHKLEVNTDCIHTYMRELGL